MLPKYFHHKLCAQKAHLKTQKLTQAASMASWPLCCKSILTILWCPIDPLLKCGVIGECLQLIDILRITQPRYKGQMLVKTIPQLILQEKKRQEVLSSSTLPRICTTTISASHTYSKNKCSVRDLDLTTRQRRMKRLSSNGGSMARSKLLIMNVLNIPSCVLSF